MATSRTTGALFLTAGLALLGAGDSDAAPRPRKSRTIRMTPADTASAVRAQGRLTFRTRRGTTYVTGEFARLTPRMTHTVCFDDTGADGPQFVTNRRGRAKIRSTAVTADARGTHHFSVVDRTGEPVLMHEDARHAASGMHDDGHMDGADHAAHHADPSHHADPAMHDDGHMDGTDHGTHHGTHHGDGDGGAGGDGATGTDHAAHHGGTASSGSGGMHGAGGTMKK